MDFNRNWLPVLFQQLRLKYGSRTFNSLRQLFSHHLRHLLKIILIAVFRELGSYPLIHAISNKSFDGGIDIFESEIKFHQPYNIECVIGKQTISLLAFPESLLGIKLLGDVTNCLYGADDLSLMVMQHASRPREINAPLEIGVIGFGLQNPVIFCRNGQVFLLVCFVPVESKVGQKWSSSSIEGQCIFVISLANDALSLHSG